MIDLDGLPRVAERADVDRARFISAVQPAAHPVVMRGLVADWPAVAWARASLDTLHDRLLQAATEAPVASSGEVAATTPAPTEIEALLLRQLLRL